MIQLLTSPAFMKNVNDRHYNFDAVAIFKAFTDAAGWKFSQDFLVPMSPEQAQQYDANSPAAIQAAQAKSAQDMQNQKFEQEKALEDQKHLGKARAERLRQPTHPPVPAQTAHPTPPTAAHE